MSLGRKIPGVGYTFLLAGMLKVLTLGGLAMSAPVEASRTAAGKVSSYLLVPVGLGMAWLAKQVSCRGVKKGGKRGRIVLLNTSQVSSWCLWAWAWPGRLNR